MSESGLLELLETIWRRANRLGDSRLRYTLVHFVLDLLSKPSGVYEQVLNYLARAFFCIQALRIDSNVSKFVAEVVHDRALIVDANVLIPLTAEGEDRQEFVRAAIEAARNVGIPLYTTMPFLDEVRRHSSWALQLADAYGEQSVELLKASKGDGGYSANAYLRGFVGWSTGQGRAGDFISYLRSCFGGSYSRPRFDQFFVERYGIRIVPESVIGTLRDGHKREYDEHTDQLNRWNTNRPIDNQKSTSRIQSETDAFLSSPTGTKPHEFWTVRNTSDVLISA